MKRKGCGPDCDDNFFFGSISLRNDEAIRFTNKMDGATAVAVVIVA